MHDADSISRLCSHTPCHVWSNCLHAPDLSDLSICHDPQWSAVIWSLIPLLIIIDRHWSPLIFRDLTSFDIARIEKQPSKFDAWQTKKTIHDSLSIRFLLFVRSLKNRLYIDSHFFPFVFSSFSPSRIFLQNATRSFSCLLISIKCYCEKISLLPKRIKTVRKLHFRTYIKRMKKNRWSCWFNW